MLRTRSALVLGWLVLLAPRLAAADGVVVGAVAGDWRRGIELQVVEVLSERTEIIPWSRFREGYQGSGADAVRNACVHVGAQRIVLGDVVSRRTVRLRALSCATGEIDIEQILTLRHGRLLRTDVFDAMQNLVPDGENEQELGGHARPPDREAVVAPPPPTPPVDGHAVLRGAVEIQTATATQAPAPVPDEPSLEEIGGLPEAHGGPDYSAPARSSTEVSLPGGPGSDLSWLEVSLGGALETRALDIPLANGDQTGYSGGGYARVGGQAVLFPFAPFVRGNWARKVGLTGSMSRGVAMPETTSTAAGLDTVVLDGSFGILLRERFATSPAIELRPAYSYGWKGFAIGQNPNVADFNYRFLRLGLEARAVFGRRLTVGLTGGYRSLLDLGEADDAYGSSRTASGWDLGGFVALRVTRTVEVSVGGEVARFSARFYGDGALQSALETDDVYPSGFARAGLVLE